MNQICHCIGFTNQLQANSGALKGQNFKHRTKGTILDTSCPNPLGASLRTQGPAGHKNMPGGSEMVMCWYDKPVVGKGAHFRHSHDSTHLLCCGLKVRPEGLGLQMKIQQHQEKPDASAGNRTRVTSMATMYSVTRPLMP